MSGKKLRIMRHYSPALRKELVARVEKMSWVYWRHPENMVFRPQRSINGFIAIKPLSIN